MEDRSIFVFIFSLPKFVIQISVWRNQKCKGSFESLYINISFSRILFLKKSVYKDLKIIFSLSFLSRILERNGETFEKNESCLQDNRETIENIDYKIARYTRFHAHSMQIGGTMLVETSGRGGEHQGRVKKIKKKRKEKKEISVDTLRSWLITRIIIIIHFHFGNAVCVLHKRSRMFRNKPRISFESKNYSIESDPDV